MAWKTARDLLLAIIGYVISGGLSFLGLAPKDLIARVWGAEVTVSFIKTMVDLDSNTLRWMFVIFSQCTLALAVVFSMLIPLRKGFTLAAKVQKKLDVISEELIVVKRLSAASIEAANKKELNAIRLLERVQNALKKWRRQKDEE